MAKKYPFRRKKYRSRFGHTEPPLDFPPPFRDRRAVEGAMWAHMQDIVGHVVAKPLHQAQQIVYQAFGTPDPEERITLAKRALDVSPDCADAYVILAEHANSRKEALDYYEKGMAAGERAIGPDAFQEHVGHFWGVLETRPYMRAREGLALCLWAYGRHEEAVSHLQEMLRINPNDNQGVRLTLASWLPYLDRDRELADLLAKYDDARATWSYSQALLAFRQRGDTPESRQLLNAATKGNPFVLEYLLGQEPLPPELPDHFGFGDRNEAIVYMTEGLKAWKSTPGAVSWARDVCKEPKTPKNPAKKAVGPTPLDKEQLKRVPRIEDTWQARVYPFPKWIGSDGDRVLPWLVLVVNRDSGLVVTTEIVADEPTAEVLWDMLAAGIRQPPRDRPHRPGRIQVEPEACWSELKPHLAEIGIELETAGDFEELDVAFESLKQYMTDDEPPGLLDMPRVTPELVGRFFKAAAGFYRKAPWRLLSDQNAIKVECDKFQSGPWYAVVMGQCGITLGLALYEDLDALKSLWVRDLPDYESARSSSGLAVAFDSKIHLSAKDFDAAQRYGWDVADPEAYPSAHRKEPGVTMRPPLSWELVLLEGCLQAIPDFLSQRKPGDMTKRRMTVPVGSGKLDLDLTWVEPE